MVITTLLALISPWCKAGFNTVISLSTACLMGSYIITLSCVIRKRLVEASLLFAQWSLGRYGLPINVLALIYAVSYAGRVCLRPSLTAILQTSSMSWSLWPPHADVTVSNMNFAPVLLIAVLGIACFTFWFDGGTRYLGGVTRVQTYMNDWR